MSKFIVIKKKTIFSSLIVFLLTISFIFSIYYISKDNTNNKGSSTTLATIDINKGTSLDFNGDGQEETLEVILENNTYVVKIKTSSKDYILYPSDSTKLIGEFKSSCPLKINILDLSRNGIPEIIIRTFKDNKPINYVFTWNKDSFINIFTSSDNILGILDSKNSKTPKILSLSSSEGDSSTHSYIFNGNKLKDTTFSKTNVPNLNLVQSFIDLIEAPYELSDTPDIFSSTIDSNDLAILWSLDKTVYNYAFQNGYFQDISWDDSGSITSINWCLSFEKAKKLDSLDNSKELLIYLTLEKDPYNELKISTIKKVQ